MQKNFYETITTTKQIKHFLNIFANYFNFYSILYSSFYSIFQLIPEDKQSSLLNKNPCQVLHHTVI